jgi:MraZ protein
MGSLPHQNRGAAHGRSLVAPDFPVDLDGAGRVLVSPELRMAALLEKEVMLLGMGSHFELWDAQTYAAKEQAAMAQGMPDALKNFTF